MQPQRHTYGEAEYQAHIAAYQPLRFHPAKRRRRDQKRVLVAGLTGFLIGVVVTLMWIFG